MYTPVYPSFTTLKWGLRGSKLYRHVFVMRGSRGDEREEQGRKRNRNESEETRGIKTSSPLPLPATRIAGLAQL